jgi:hypothetical protein
MTSGSISRFFIVGLIIFELRNRSKILFFLFSKITILETFKFAKNEIVMVIEEESDDLPPCEIYRLGSQSV